MKNFELYNPVRVIFGNGESEDIGRHVAGLGKKALVVSYGSATLRPLRDRIEASLQSRGIEVVPFYCITANPLLSHIREAVELCRAQGVDLCIAVGGGSVMDATKAIAAGVLYEHDLWKMFISRHDRDVCIPPERSLPSVMIPTLPATSSEMNCIAVATNDETKEKAYIYTAALYPTLAIMDPALTCTLPAHHTVVGAVDAMSHVLEAYLNGDQHSPLQDRLHEGILVTLMSELREILKDPTNVEHRANMQWAACLAWNGYLQAGLEAGTPMHQMGHVLSALYNTPHGITLAIFMDAFFRYTSTLNEERARRFALLGTKIFGLDPEMPAAEAAVKTVDMMVNFMDEIGVPHTLSGAGVPLSDIEKIADEIVAHGCNAQGTLPSIPPIGRDGIMKILNMAK